jgi:polar amino acid transport system substrate-binding protein
MSGSTNSRLLAATLALAAAVTAACATSSHTATSAVASPGGSIAYCSDISYAPAEYYQLVRSGGREFTRKPVGADIDTGREVAKRLGLTARFVDTPFSGIIDALAAHRCDAIISFMNDTPARRRRLAFVDYLQAGQSLMLKKQAAAEIHQAADLSGKSVAVAAGTTEEAFLAHENTTLRQAGRTPIRVMTFRVDSEAINALAGGRVNAYFGDTPVVTDAVKHNGALAVGPQLVGPVPIGIAFGMDDPRVPAAEKAVRAMYVDGTMAHILTTWKLSAFALSK